MAAPTPNPPRRDGNDVRRFAEKFARDILITARIIELRRLAEQTAALWRTDPALLRSELPDADPSPPPRRKT
jgi:hypothetical protein